jgi:transcription antitermination factor NusG
MTEPNTEIKAGDRVRAREGAFKGEVGTALRVVTSRDEGRTSCNVLVSFPAGRADYLSAEALEKAEERA